MKLGKSNEVLQKECLELLENSEDKSKAIVEVVEKLNENAHADLIKEIREEAEKASHDEAYRKTLGLRTLSAEEKKFYEFLRAKPSQAITAEQVDIIPTSIIDNTLANVKSNSRIAELIDFAPADVTKWISAEKTGTSAWGNLTEALKNELTVTFTSFNIEVGKLHVFLVIPKAIRDLSLEFVDRYITAIINEAMNDGIEAGFIDGSGVDAPIGITRLVDASNEDKTAKEKDVLTTIKGFTPKQLAPVKKTLSNGGLRAVPTLYLVCNPSDNYEYVEPALYGENVDGSYSQKSNTRIEVIETANCPLGKAIFTMPHLYDMGFSGLKINEYDQTKADEDANLLVAKIYGNGRAKDNNTSVVFDVTKLEEYIPTFKTVTTA